MTTWKITIHETLEHIHYLEANTEDEARDKWEHVVVADYDIPGDAIERHIEKIQRVPRAREVNQ